MMSKKNKHVSPFVKWVGGKRQLLSEIIKHIPKEYSTYYEPFIGGGAVLLHLQPKKAVISDCNAELINLYQVIKDEPEALIENLRTHCNEEDYFYEIRALDRQRERYESLSPVEKASRIIFLNKTCFNGLFRVNSSGEFNAPFGRYKNPNIVNEDTVRAVSTYLSRSKIKILNKDYTKAVARAHRKAFIYFDPPYDPISNSSSFTGYTKNGFGKEEQERLKALCDRLNRRNVRFLLSNSCTPFINELYKEYTIIPVQAKRTINSKANGRGAITEVLVKNYE